MASILNTLFCAGLATVLWTCIGLAVAARVLPGPLALPLSPMLGWAVHSAAVLPVFFAVGLSRATVTAVTAVALIVALAAWRTRKPPSVQDPQPGRVPVWAFAGAALLALAVMAAILPKTSVDGVALAAPIFDHSKAALVDEMARAGVPPANPFVGEVGGPPRLSYYYLWHFSAAELALLTGATGWEADAGLTAFTALASLALMMGVATWLSGRAAAAGWVLVLAATASLRPIVSWLVGAEAAYAWIQWSTGFGGWLFQTAWAPQHVASAACVVLAVVLLGQLGERRSPLGAIAFALTAAAAFESSTWIGGLTLPLAATAIAPVVLATAAPPARLRLALYIAGAVLIALVLAFPLLYDQLHAAALRGGETPIAIAPYRVLGDAVPVSVRRVLDVPAYWLVLLVVEFPAFYLAGVFMLAWLVKARASAPGHAPMVPALALLALVSLGVGWMLTSTIGGNNDLGWRGVLPGVLVLIAAAAAALAHYWQRPAWLAAPLAFVMLGLPAGAALIYSFIFAAAPPSGKVFATTPALWQAVRRHSAAGDRIANNPLHLADMTPWPVNISWALMANRRSCYAGLELALPFAPVPRQRRKEIDALFVRVFAGAGSGDDIRALAKQHRCRLAVVTPQDGAWTRDPFAANPYFRLIEAGPAWRIYQAMEPTP
jgi:hypothetical protein